MSNFGPIFTYLVENNVDIAHVEIAVIVVVFTALLSVVFSGSSDTDTLVSDVIKTRRSVEQFSGPATRDQIQKALQCAIHAPNHFLTEPWRFRLLGPKGKEVLGKLNEKFGSGGQFGEVPDYLVVSIAPVKTKDFSVWTMNALEDHAACSCAIQNFMLSCASQGIATKWMTGKMGIAGDDILRDACGVDNEEHYMGTILIGRPEVPLASMPTPDRKNGLRNGVFVVTA